MTAVSSRRMSFGESSKAAMATLIDKNDMKAAFNLCFLKHKVLDSEMLIQKIEDIKLKSLGQIRVYPNAETKARALKIKRQEEETVNVAQGSSRRQGLKRKAGEVEEQEAMNLAQAAKPQQGLFYGNYTPPKIPPVPSLQQFIQVCSEPFEKQLTRTDVKDDQSRLAMSKDNVEKHLIPLLNEDEDLVHGIVVKAYDLAGKEYKMTFKIWAHKVHVLTTGWKEFCKDHELVPIQDFVTLWMFRNLATDNLCFVIEVRKLNVSETIKRKRTRGKIDH